MEVCQKRRIQLLKTTYIANSRTGQILSKIQKNSHLR